MRTRNVESKVQVTNEWDNSNDGYIELLESVINHFNKSVSKGQKLLKTNVQGLYKAYIANLPLPARQHYTCWACEHFIDKFGGLVTVSDKGVTKSVIWEDKDAPEFFKKSIKAMKDLVLSAAVNGVFASAEPELGQALAGGWEHFSVTLPTKMLYKETPLKNAEQYMADKVQEFEVLCNSLDDYSLENIDYAVQLLGTETLYRGDKVIGNAKWFKELKEKLAGIKNSKNRDNLIWSAVASAPEGWAKVRGNMLGTLLDDIRAGLSVDYIKGSFKKKMDPANHGHSQSAPTENQIVEAEKAVHELKLEDSLKREFAKKAGIPKKNLLWEPKQRTVKSTETKSTGVFGNITPRNKTVVTNTMDLPTSVMTWDKFQRTVLPTASNIEAKVDNASKLMALVTEAVKGSKPILQWDNPFSWYYNGGIIDSEIKRRVEAANGRYENNKIRCSLIWEGYTDLDLHCIDPNRDELYYGSPGDKEYKQGGYLDIDMNGGSHRNAHPVENIRWATSAPRGRYKFFVVNFKDRSKDGIIPFKMELEIEGRVYTYEGVAKGYKYQETVFEFMYIPGQAPVFYVGGTNVALTSSVMTDWNITSEFVKVTAITTSPNLWGKTEATHVGSHIFFLLDECKDLSGGKGRGFINEMLKSELRPFRAVLEAYTASEEILGADEATACGVGYSKDNEWNLTLKVTEGKSTRLIKIDRFD